MFSFWYVLAQNRYFMNSDNIQKESRSIYEEDNALHKNNCIKIATSQMMRGTPEIPTIVRTL